MDQTEERTFSDLALDSRDPEEIPAIFAALSADVDDWIRENDVEEIGPRRQHAVTCGIDKQGARVGTWEMVISVTFKFRKKVQEPLTQTFERCIRLPCTKQDFHMAHFQLEEAGQRWVEKTAHAPICSSVHGKTIRRGKSLCLVLKIKYKP